MVACLRRELGRRGGCGSREDRERSCGYKARGKGSGQGLTGPAGSRQLGSSGWGPRSRRPLSSVRAAARRAFSAVGALFLFFLSFYLTSFFFSPQVDAFSASFLVDRGGGSLPSAVAATSFPRYHRGFGGPRRNKNVHGKEEE